MTFRQLFNRYISRPVLTTKAVYMEKPRTVFWYEAHPVGKDSYFIFTVLEDENTRSSGWFDKGQKYTREQIVEIFSSLEKEEEFSSCKEAPSRKLASATEANKKKKAVHYSLV